MNKKISVIIPVYNAGKRLAGCLDSVLGQTLDGIEVILVLDCPSDGSGDLARTYARKDGRIRIVEHRENRNIGCSRNDGIEVATGEYLAFMDHDDHISRNWYAEMYEKACSEDCDVLLGADLVVSEGHSSVLDVSFLENAGAELKARAIRDLLLWGEGRPYTSAICNIHPNFYRRTFVEEHRIRFVDTVHTSAEDYLFQLEAVLAAGRIAFTDIAGYHHVLFPGSEGSRGSYRSYKKRFSALENARRVLDSYPHLPEDEVFFSRGALKVCLTLWSGTLPGAGSLSDFRTMTALVREKKGPWRLAAKETLRAAVPWQSYGLFGRIKRRMLLLFLKFL